MGANTSAKPGNITAHVHTHTHTHTHIRRPHPLHIAFPTHHARHRAPGSEMNTSQGSVEDSLLDSIPLVQVDGYRFYAKDSPDNLRIETDDHGKPIIMAATVEKVGESSRVVLRQGGEGGGGKGGRERETHGLGSAMQRVCSRCVALSVVIFPNYPLCAEYVTFTAVATLLVVNPIPPMMTPPLLNPVFPPPPSPSSLLSATVGGTAYLREVPRPPLRPHLPRRLSGLHFQL